LGAFKNKLRFHDLFYKITTGTMSFFNIRRKIKLMYQQAKPLRRG